MVTQRFDNGDDTWLASDAGGKEWAVAFHGLRWNVQKDLPNIVHNGFD